ncbi:MAG TPA: hypothetical protein VJB89_02825 [Candidatus Nanoarchaeia archaeon]|nr:hypothetical protein [Candidatus Nanoarchaeia archaeon]
MRIIHSDYHKGILKFQIENLDDLWHLNNMISKGDILKGKDIRKIKLSETKIIKKNVFLSINVERVELGANLRVLGKIIESSNEEVTKGSYHGFVLEEGGVFELNKKFFLEYHKKHIIEATKERKERILIVIVDREEVSFALLKKNGFEILDEIKGEVESKYFSKNVKDEFFDVIKKMIEEYRDRYKINRVVIGGSNFWIGKFNADLKIVCHSSGRTGVNDILKTTEFRKFVKDERVSFELELIEELLRRIAKNERVVYGFNDVLGAVNNGSVEKLLISEKLMAEKREELDLIMQTVEECKGEVHIINSDNEAGKKLDGLGGISALLRY